MVSVNLCGQYSIAVFSPDNVIQMGNQILEESQNRVRGPTGGGTEPDRCARLSENHLRGGRGGVGHTESAAGPISKDRTSIVFPGENPSLIGLNKTVLNFGLKN